VPETPPDELLVLAQGFADKITRRVDSIIELTAPFSALAAGDGTSGRVTVGVLDGDLNFRSIPLSVGGKERLRLLVKFYCCWDSGSDYLAVDESWFHTRVRDKDDPLFRYEYLRGASGRVPAAHIQMHAHRDEFVYLLMAGDRGRPKVRRRTGVVPKLSEFHFPLGGHRFRPCLEDVLEALILEFGLDTRPGWRTAIQDGREEWRRIQTRAVVRDAPSEAVEALRELGWEVTPPDKPLRDNRERLRAF
jgi:hypothetical protein